MNTLSPPVRLTERTRTMLEMLAAGYRWQNVLTELNLTDEQAAAQWVQAEMELGAKTPEHAIALAIRGGHIL